MVRCASSNSNPAVQRVELLSNLSCSLERLTGFFLALSAVTVLVALWPTLMGYWPIMVIAVIHLGIVGCCLRMAWRGHWARHEVTVEGDRVRIEQRSVARERIVFWPASRVRVQVLTLRDEPRVLLCLHDRKIELGRFLPIPERMEAAATLTRLLAPHSLLHRQTTN